MNGKNLIVVVLVSMVSIALAFGITFLVTRGNSQVITMQTPAPQETSQPQPSAVVVLPVDPNSTLMPTPSKNCTFPIDTWIQYPDAWKIDTYRIGEKTYTKKEMLDVLRGNSTDARGMLLTQIFIVVLNQQNGADATGIRTAFSEAISWVQTFRPGSTPSDGDLQKAESIAKTLQRYNDGLLGVPACQYNVSVSTPVRVPFQQMTRTLTSSPTSSVSPAPGLRTRIPPTPTIYREPQEKPKPKPTNAPPTSVPPTTPPQPTTAPPTSVPPNPTAVPTEAPPEPTIGATSPPPPPPPPPTQPPAPTVGSSPPTSVITTAPQPPPNVSPTPRKTKKPKSAIQGFFVPLERFF